jgi:DUF305 family protein family protein
MRFSATLAAAAALVLLARPADAGPDPAAHGGGHGVHGEKHRSQPGGHAAHAAARGMAATSATQEFRAAHHKMMQSMNQPYTGDPDVDFRIQMIPHHQGAIDMARVTLKHATDPWTRQLAEAVILEQQREIAEMQAWLARRGIAPPQGGQPRYIVRSTSFPRHEEDAGTRDEARGQSWAPSSGIR